jgi:Bacterial pre-peptidase C-terminal domain
MALITNLNSSVSFLNDAISPISQILTSESIQLNPAIYLFENAGNTPAEAQNIETVTNYSPYNTSGRVGGSDLSDFFRFTLDGHYGYGDLQGNSSNTNVRLSLTGLSNDADLRVINDRNNNGQVDPGEVIARSTRGSNLSEYLDIGGLQNGTYYAEVYQFSGATSYNLDITAYGGSGMGIEPNDSLTNPTNMHFLNAGMVFGGSVNGAPSTPPPPGGLFGSVNDPKDFYSFELDARSFVLFNLSGMSADADIRLLNSNGVYIDGSALGSNSIESFSETLNPGKYILEIAAFGNASTNYTLGASSFLV